MQSEKIVSPEAIQRAIESLGFKACANEGRLMLAELLLKAGAGYYNSHTEEAFVRVFNLMQKDRTPNKRGRQFLCAMLYNHSNRQPLYFELMQQYRVAT